MFFITRTTKIVIVKENMKNRLRFFANNFDKILGCYIVKFDLLFQGERKWIVLPF